MALHKRKKQLFSHSLLKKVTSVFFIFLVLVLLANNFVMSRNTLKNPINNTKNTSYKRIADPNTMDSYRDSLISSTFGSRYAGRIWTDKTVLTNDLTLDIDTDGISKKITSNSDFLHVYSVLGSGVIVKGGRVDSNSESIPIDVVIVIDVSSSMGGSATDTRGKTKEDSRIGKVLDSVNNGIDYLMSIGEENRVGIVVYGSYATELLPLGHYTANSPGQYITLKGETSSGDWQPTVGGTQHFNLTTNVQEIPSAITVTNCGSNTNPQSGIWMGLKQLSTASNTVYTTKITKTKVSHQPVLLFFSDGGANAISKGEWYAPNDTGYGGDGGSGNNNDELHQTRFEANTSSTHSAQNGSAAILQTLMTAAYSKSLVEHHYAEEAQKENVKQIPTLDVYSFGIDTDAIRTLATSGDTDRGAWATPRLNAIMDPSVYFKETDVYTYPTNMNTTALNHTRNVIANAYQQWQNWVNGLPASLDYLAGRSGRTTETLVFDQLPGDLNNGVTKADIIKNINYVPEGHFYEVDSENLQNLFSELLQNISTSYFNPLAGENDSGASDSITYTDPIGQYMEVKEDAVTIDGVTSDMSLLLFGTMYHLNKVAIYDYTFNSMHRGPNHNSNDMNLDFYSGWYDSNGNYLASGGDWTKGDKYYVDSNTVRKWIPNLDESGNITDQQRNTVYTLYDFVENSEGTKINPSYDDDSVSFDIKDIHVWVEDKGQYINDSSGAILNAGYTSSICVDIPVNALPLQMVNVDLDKNDMVTSYQTNLDDKIASTPFRLFYGVGLKDSIFTDDGLDIDMAKLSPEYIAKNKKNDIVYFYSNYYSNTTYDGYVTDTLTERTRGDAYVSFSPSSTNRYYTYQRPLPLYEVATTDLTNGVYEDVVLHSESEYSAFVAQHTKVQDSAQFDSNKWYYVILDYYIPSSTNRVYVAVPRQGKQFESNAESSRAVDTYLSWYNLTSGTWENYSTNKPSYGNPSDWVIATLPFGLRVGDMVKSLKEKTSNVTNTSYNYYLPTSQISMDSAESTSDIIINTYLGNNGRIEVSDSLMFVTKSVDIPSSLKNTLDANKKFNFYIKLENHEGDFEAIKVVKNPYSNEYELRISTIDLLTDNHGFLQDINFEKVVYRLNGQSYYIYIGDNKATGDTGGDSVFRVYSAPDNDNHITLTLSGMTTYVENPDNIDNSLKTELNKYKTYDDENRLGSLDFWIKKVYLIPVREVNDGWEASAHDLSSYSSLSEFVVAHLDSYLSGAQELTSPYPTKTTYLTEKVYFGYEESVRPEQMPEGWNADDWANQQPFVAHVQLKNGEGLMFSGLKEKTQYEIKEVLSNEDEQEGYYFNYIKLAEKDTASVDGMTVTGQVNANYNDEVDYHNIYYAPVDLSISKTVSGENSDPNKEWTFYVSLKTTRENLLRDSYQVEYQNIEGVESKVPETVSFAQQPDGSYLGEIHLKHGQTAIIKEIPYQTTYEVVEKEANQDYYITKSNNASGTLNDEKTEVTFANQRYAIYDLDLEKTVVGNLGDKNREWNFEIHLTPNAEIPLETQYSYVSNIASRSGTITLTDNKDGSYTGTLKLKHGEKVTIQGLPEQTKYEIRELEENLDDYQTVKTGETGIVGETQSTSIQFTNAKYSRHKLTIMKEVSGGLGEKDKVWNFQVKFTPDKDVLFENQYSYVGGHTVEGVTDPDNGTIQLTEQNGSYVGTVSLKHGQSITILGIPERTQYEVVELEANQNEYFTTSKDTSGTLTKEETIVTFDNKKPAKKDITIHKQVLGDLGEKDKAWTFKIYFKAEAPVILENTYSYVGSKSGKIDLSLESDGTLSGTFTLKHDESITIKDLPENTTYFVEELEANQDGYITKIPSNSRGVLDGDAPVIEFVNTRLSKNSLTIIKEVQGSAGDKKKEWNFKVTLKPLEGISLDSYYNYDGGTIFDEVEAKPSGTVEIKEENGEYVFYISLKHGQTVTIKDIPGGTVYKMEEIDANQDGYFTVIQGTSEGTFDETLTSIVKFINKKPSKQNLTMSKEVLGGLGEIEKDWVFEIILKPDEYILLEDSYPYTGSKNGTLNLKKDSEGNFRGSVSLKHDETITIEGIPENTTYEIKELEANQDGYITRVEGNTSGQIVDKDLEVKFQNIKLARYQLTLQKIISGNAVEKDKSWNFKITLTSPTIQKLDSSYSTIKTITSVDTDGEEYQETVEDTLNLIEVEDGIFEGTISILAGETITIKDLPEGTTYEIVEQEANQDGYTTSYENCEGILETDIEATVTNVRNMKVPPTNDSMTKYVKFLMIAIFVVLDIILVWQYQKRRIS